MKVAIKAAQARYEKFKPAGDYSCLDMVFFAQDAPDAEVIAGAGDAQALVIDAISTASKELIEGMPNLKFIQSEGVGYNGVCLDAANARGITVSNNAGINATAVAEQSILLMLGLLRSTLAGNDAVLAGKQIDMKERLMVSGIRELADCNVGIIGLGAIGQALAHMLQPFGCKVYYSSRHAKSAQLEQELNVQHLPQDELVRTCDIVSLHCAVTPETEGMVDATFLEAMKEDAILINTGRGDLVDNVALASALERGVIGGAGLDTIAPEPVLPDNPLLNMSDKATARMLVSPHIGGVTTSTFRRGFANIYSNLLRVAAEEPPINIVNG